MSPQANDVAVSFVVVTYNSTKALERALPPLLAQLGDRDEVVLVDNASSDGTADFVAGKWPFCRLVRSAKNLGFAAGCNLGARHAGGELLVFINPDAAPAPGFVDVLRQSRGWDAWMPLITMEGGSEVNTSGGVVHFTGVSWAGETGSPAADLAPGPRDIGFVSGACFAVRRTVWDDHGGFAPDYFMYCEDLDLSLRVRLTGGRLGIEPEARVDHDYQFEKRPEKWRLLERNRLATIVRTYPNRLLLVVAPALVITELALFCVAIIGGWAPQKARALADTMRWMPRLLRERRAIQATRTISPREFAVHLTPELSSPYLGRPARSRSLQMALRAYWAVAIKLLD